MPSFAYQSFESSASSNHNAYAILNRRFTQSTNARVTGEGVQALIPPVNPDMPSEIYEGPMQLLPVLGNDTVDTNVILLQSHLANVFRHAHSNLEEDLCAFVCGELDVSGQDFAAMRSFPNLDAHVVAATRNCQCFTGFINKSMSGIAQPLVGGTGYYAFLIGGMSVVFVHVPNRICSSESEIANFYSGINNTLVQGGAPGIDIVLGDTNQQSANFTRTCLQSLNQGSYANAHEGAIEPVDTYLYSTGGTNSGGDKMYDVCVYNSSRVSIDRIAYVSQSSTGSTVTDHMGLMVKAHLK